MRPCPRNLKATCPQQGATWQARDRDIDRHAMQSEVGYLLSGLWKGREEGSKGRRGREERNRERDREGKSGKNGARHKLPLSRRDGKEKGLRLEAEDQLASADRGGSGHGLSLKGTAHHYTLSLQSYIGAKSVASALCPFSLLFVCLLFVPVMINSVPLGHLLHN